MCSSYDAANFFISLALQTDEDTITNLKLNKLMFFAQGHHLAKTGTPLFNEDIEAWQHGPVVPSIYGKYKVCGSNSIAVIDEGFSIDCFSRDEYITLLDIAREYGKYSASYLRGKTHEKDTPWYKAYHNASSIIPSDDIKEYFSRRNPVLKFSDLFEKKGLPVYNSRDEEGIIVLSADEFEDFSEYDNV